MGSKNNIRINKDINTRLHNNKIKQNLVKLLIKLKEIEIKIIKYFKAMIRYNLNKLVLILLILIISLGKLYPTKKILLAKFSKNLSPLPVIFAIIMRYPSLTEVYILHKSIMINLVSYKRKINNYLPKLKYYKFKLVLLRTLSNNGLFLKKIINKKFKKLKYNLLNFYVRKIICRNSLVRK